MTYPVKWFTSAMPGAPRCSGTAGDLVTLLDTCLINGFNVNGVGSLVVTGGIATATFATAHGYLQHQIVLIAGSTPTALNGDKRVLTADTYTITFDATGVADGTATGTIECRTAPVGSWVKAFETTQKAAYKSNHPDSTGVYLRLDDTGTKYATPTCYEAMSDIDTGTASWGGTYYWWKSLTANTVANSWALVGDGLFFFFFPIASTINDTRGVCVFGDFVPYKLASTYHAIHEAGTSASEAHHTNFALLTDNNVTSVICRGLSGAANVSCVKYGSKRSQFSGYTGEASPHPTNGGALVSYPVNIREDGGSTIGHIPGLYQLLQPAFIANNTVDTFSDTGRLFFAIRSNATNVASVFSQIIVDLEDWRE
jgi:hypothetical protein